jgi:hypothetical protein
MCSPLTLLAELALRALIALSVARPAHRSVAHPQPPDEGLCEGVLLWLARSVAMVSCAPFLPQRKDSLFLRSR